MKDATSAAQNAQIQSWIDNVIVPILVQQILKTPPQIGEDLNVDSGQR
jgi:hypothetical protein